MALSVHPAQDHPPDVHGGIEMQAAQNHCRRCSRYLVAVDNQNDRSLKKFGKLGRTEFPGGIDTVEKPPIAFNDGNGAVHGVARKGADDLIVAHEKGVQVIAVAGCRLRQPGSVDIVRPLFERGNWNALPAQGDGHCHGQGRFSRPTTQGGHNETRALSVHHPSPRVHHSFGKNSASMM